MLALADFLESLLHGAALASLCLVVGSVAWALWVLRVPWQRPPPLAVDRCLMLLGAGGVALALGQAGLLAFKGRVLAESLGRSALGDFAATTHFRAGMARVFLALAVAGLAVALRRQPATRSRWVLMTIAAGLLAAGGAWLTHASGRMDDRPLLMTLTALHQVAAAVWVGGLIQLGGLWHLTRRHAEIDALWPPLVGRFSRLALASVIALVLVGLPLTWTYTGSVGGLVGTGYGSLVLTKVMLLAVALVLAACNFGVARGAERSRAATLRTRLPYLVEAEAIILVIVLFAATALSAQPPPADQSRAEHATVGEVVEVFRPKLPSLRTPSVEVMREQRAPAVERRERSREAYLWSNFSHNVAGLILLGMSLVALGGLIVRPEWSRHWPLGFAVLAAFIYLRAAANEGTWPFGATPLWQVDAEGLQHRLAAILVLSLGLLEWRARAHRRPRALLPYVFPALAAAGAVLLLTHSHAAFQLKSSYLVQVTHTTMGALAGLLAVARWLELRLAPPWRRVAEGAAGTAMLIIALILVFYREANITIPPQ